MGGCLKNKWGKMVHNVYPPAHFGYYEDFPLYGMKKDFESF